MKPIIEVSHLSKKYKYGESQPYYTLRDTLVGIVKTPFQLFNQDHKQFVLRKDEFWALKDISFNLNKGDVLGVIGQNGSGKSTLLKILSRITPPTSGKVILRGRVGSLLEIGTGFQQELTGRENIYLNGAILGMTRREINRKFDDIVNFSGIKKFLDTPVKHYSSGMYMRLAFSVAAFLDSEILLVDEVLAVGDVEFQKKCLSKMNDVANKDGRTVLFVSHNMGVIEQLCNKCVLLDKGTISKIGIAHEVIENYLTVGMRKKEKPAVDKYRNSNITNAPVYIDNIYVKGSQNEIPTIEMGKAPTIVISIFARKEIKKGNISLSLYNSEDVKTDMAFSLDDGFYLNVRRGYHRIEFTPSNISLPPGGYSIGIGLNQSYNTTAWDSISYYPIFEIENRKSVIQWDSRPWAIHHSQNNKWEMN